MRTAFEIPKLQYPTGRSGPSDYATLVMKGSCRAGACAPHEYLCELRENVLLEVDRSMNEYDIYGYEQYLTNGQAAIEFLGRRGDEVSRMAVKVSFADSKDTAKVSPTPKDNVKVTLILMTRPFAAPDSEGPIFSSEYEVIGKHADIHPADLANEIVELFSANATVPKQLRD